MKVNELRTIVKSRTKEELQTLIAEMYKQIPKKIREQKEIDALIENPDQFIGKKKGTTKTVMDVDFSYTEYETKQFIKDAYDQNYFAPNRIIPKKERAKWRFTAKRLVDELTYLANQPENAKESVKLLEDLYGLFCYASEHYVFASQEPFDTIKIPQHDFFARIVNFKKQIDEPQKWIREVLVLMLKNDIGFYITSGELTNIMHENLSNAPLKEAAVRISEQLMQEKLQTIASTSKKSLSQVKYKTVSYVNNLVRMIFICQTTLGESEEAIRVFKQFYIEKDDEIKLYVLLDWIKDCQQSKDWIREYEKAISNGIEPRVELQNMYKKTIQTNAFPE